MCIKLVNIVALILILGLAFICPVNAELVAWWRLDDVSGTVAVDSSGNGHDGTLLLNPDWIVGKYGGALEFGGVAGQRVEIEGYDGILGTQNRTVMAWIKATGTGDWISWGQNVNTQKWICRLNASAGNGTVGALRTECSGGYIISSTVLTDGEWHHVVSVLESTGSPSIEDITMYVDGVEETISGSQMVNINTVGGRNLWIADGHHDRPWPGVIDDVRMYNHAMAKGEIIAAMEGGEGYPFALGPDPKNGTLHSETWVSLGWTAGDFAVSHDVYLGDNFDDVNDGTGDTFRANQEGVFFIAGFPGNPYPDGLVPGTTYYWRIDEVNETEPNSPWKGDIWSFSIPPKTAYDPDPAEGAEFIDLNVQLTWTAGFGSKLHYIVFGDDFEEVNNAAAGVPHGTTTYSPGPLELAKTYYWRVDEFDGLGTYKGQIWSFTTEGAVSGPNPADGTVDVSPTQNLTWVAGAVAASHEVYFGTDADAVANATTTSPEYKGPKALGDESYDPGKLMLNTAYFWRIDEVNDNPDSPWAGNVWSFTTGNYFVIDDFEHYDVDDNQIWFSWHDGLGYGTPDFPPFFAGNGTGAAVGDETTASYTEETIVHGGNQSMPVAYDNNKQGFAKYSEVELTLTDQRDWTEEGVAELSIWFRGNAASVGSFVEGPVGTYTMTATGADIWNQADEFHFSYKMLTGAGSIVARVESVELTNNWAKAGVMIRETLDAGSKFAAVYITPTNTDGTATNGCRYQARTETDTSATSDTSVATDEQKAIVAPYWVKLERDIGGGYRGYHSSDGTAWTPMPWNPQFITMSSNVYVGLALTSHDNSATCEARFSNVTITGTVAGQWTNQDVGIASNAPEPLYVAITDSSGTSAVAVHDDANAATIDVWTEWIIPLSTFEDQGVNMTDVDKIALGQGTRGNMTDPGGSGNMFYDDIRLYQVREAVEEETAL